MKKTATPELIRESVLAHLGALQSFGVRHTTRSVTARKITFSDAHVAPAVHPSVSATSGPQLSPPVTAEELAGVATLEALSGLIGDCRRCKLCPTRKNIVFGSGNPQARLMFVGEGPGADEDEQGLPFVGRAGQLLTKMIEAMGLSREKDVYIANIVKCRPPGNRNPEPDEIAACMPFVKKQIETVAPTVVVCLGKIATQALLDTQVPISKLRGRLQSLNGTPVMPTFHPAFLLRNPPMKKFAWEDLQQVMKLLEKPS